MTPLVDSSQAVLQVQGLGKRYRLFASPRERLQALLGWADRSRPHWALKEVSFELHRGQCLPTIRPVSPQGSGPWR